MSRLGEDRERPGRRTATGRGRQVGPMPILNALVVDDVATVRMQLRIAIKEILHDCHVFESENALDAARFLSRFIPEVVLLDLNMPGISGLQFLEKLERITSGRKPPIIVSISSDISPGTLKALQDRGAYDILPKPFDRMALATVLLRLIQMARLRRVLIVDDSATVRTLVRRIVQKSRFNLAVEEAATGDEAMRLFRGQGFDVAFMDVNMPGVDGLEAAGEILYTRQGVHIVMMSGDGNENVRRAAAHIGVQHFLTKPFYPHQVDSVLHTLYDMSNSRFIEAARQEVFTQVEEL